MKENEENFIKKCFFFVELFIKLIILNFLSKFREKFESKSSLPETKRRRKGRRRSKNSTAPFVAASAIPSVAGKLTTKAFLSKKSSDKNFFFFFRLTSFRDLRRIFPTIPNNSILTFGDKQFWDEKKVKFNLYQKKKKKKHHLREISHAPYKRRIKKKQLHHQVLIFLRWNKKNWFSFLFKKALISIHKKIKRNNVNSLIKMRLGKIRFN